MYMYVTPHGWIDDNSKQTMLYLACGGGGGVDMARARGVPFMPSYRGPGGVL